jgi:hypothetical protein
VRASESLLKELRTIYPSVRESLKRFSGFVDLGIGHKEVRGQLTNEIAWRVYVLEKKAHELLAINQLVPRRIAGISTDVVAKLRSRPTFGEDERATLVPGIKIESDFKERGTLGCFARLKSDQTPVLLSNHHILYGFSKNSLDVGQPKPSCCWWCKCKIIAKNVGDGRNAFNLVTVDVVDDEGKRKFHGSETDCAIARLNGKRPFSNDIPFIGTIAGTPPAGDFGVVVGSEVEKVGFRTGHTKGIIIESPAITQKYRGGSDIPKILLPYSGSEDQFLELPESINQLFIMPKPGFPKFVEGGDSGSVVVNNQKQVIGLISRKIDIDAGLRKLLKLPEHVETVGIANPIHKVLSAMNIEIPPNYSSTNLTHGEILEMENHAVWEEERRFREEINALRRQVEATSLGKTLISEMDLHQEEIFRLVNRQRRVMVTWHRHHGPAFSAHCLKCLRESDHKVPDDIEGTSRTSLITAMAEVLSTHGSEQLREAIKIRLPQALESAYAADDVKSLRALIERL